MPYILQERRDGLLKHGDDMQSAGELNFLLCRHYLKLDQFRKTDEEEFRNLVKGLLSLYIEHRGICYQTYNDIIGVLKCLEFEMKFRQKSKTWFNYILRDETEIFYKNIVFPYELGARQRNGDVYPSAVEE